MEEKFLRKYIDNWICQRVKEPGRITWKEQMMEENKKAIKANQHPH